MKSKQDLMTKIKKMTNSIDIDKFIRHTFHLKKEKASGYKLGKGGIKQVRTPSKFERNIIESFS